MARTKGVARQAIAHDTIYHLPTVYSPQTTQATVKKPDRYTPDPAARLEMRPYYKPAALLINRRAFERLVYDTTQEFASDINIQPSAMGALQESIEAYIMSLFEESNRCAIHTKNTVIGECHFQLARRLRDERG